MKSKTFVHSIGTVLVVYLLFNLLVWTQFTCYVLSNPECTGGDLNGTAVLLPVRAIHSSLSDLTDDAS